MAELPDALRLEVDRAVSGVPAARLAAAAQALSERYRLEQDGAPRLRSADDVLAYAVARLPATFAAAAAALSEVRERMPDWAPRSVLDVGAGPGSAAWAAVGVWPSLREVELLERDPRLIALGRSLAAAAPATLRSARWSEADVADLQPPATDLAVASYVVGELAPEVAAALMRRLAAACAAVVVVEPGTPRGYEVVMRARDELLAAAGTVVAPCPHDRVCPMRGSDWCHFGARLARSPAHRRTKGATLGHEDEPYSYVAVARRPATAIGGRVVRRPRYRKGLVALELCTRDGLQHDDVGRSRGDAYREARRAVWGSALPTEPS